MPRNPNPQQMTANFQAGISAAGGKYAAGVARVQDNPMTAAAAAVDNGIWAANTTAAAPRMSAKLKAVSLQQWQQAVQSYGQSRYTSSAQKAGAHYATAAQTLASAGAAASAAAAALPKSDPLGRVRASINAMKSAFGKPTI